MVGDTFVKSKSIALHLFRLSKIDYRKDVKRQYGARSIVTD
jgi:hypothetical protein